MWCLKALSEVFPASSRFWWLQASLGLWPPHSNVPQSSHGFSSSLPTWVFSGCHLQGHLSEDGGSAQVAQDDLTLRSLVTFTKTLFSSNVTFTGPRA